MAMHTRVDGWLANVLPAHLAYRLTLDCSAA
jgi:hypothetical protein